MSVSRTSVTLFQCNQHTQQEFKTHRSELPDFLLRAEMGIFRLDTNGLPELTPTLAPGETTIVAVGFDATDLTGIVKQKGIAVSVPYAFTVDDVQNVVHAVLYDS
ncbi:hypothetical protein COOONC_17070 [Cooperia oncophora]